MPDSAQTTVVATLHSGQEIYDAIMRTIDPELCSDQLPLLEAKSKSETDEQKKLRAERYTKAFAEYDVQIAAFAAELNAQVNTMKRKAFASAEQKSRSEESAKLQQMESLINS